MNDCVWTDRVAAAAHDEHADSAVDAHIRSCAECRSLATTIRALALEAAAAERDARERLPDPGSIYAEFSTQRQAASTLHPSVVDATHALRAVLLVEVIASAIAALVVLAGTAWGISRLGSTIGLDLGQLLDFGGGPGAAGDSGTGALVTAAIVIAIAAVHGVLGLRLDGRSGPAGF